MDPLLQRIARTLRLERLLPEGASLLVAVSGGLDSMVLLHLLTKLAARHDWKLTVAHFNHRLRGASSDGDEQFVRAAAARLGLPCVVEAADVRALARAHRISLEMAAREARHAFLARAARHAGCRHVALAHHAGDQVELFFLRLLRGAGSEGLAGMTSLAPSPAEAGLLLFRPLLGVEKGELAACARRHQLRFRLDASNADTSLLRNRLRHWLLPKLQKEFQPRLAQVVSRAMTLLAAESEFVEAAAAKWRRSRRPAFNRLPVAVQRVVLKHDLLRLGIEPEFDWIEQLRLVPATAITACRGVIVERCEAGDDLLRLRPLLGGSVPGAPLRSRIVRVGPEEKARPVQFRGARISLARVPGKELPPRVAGVEWFDADAVGPRVRLRHWRPGDRFQPIGLPSAVKLQDLFTNAKVPRGERHERVVAEAADGAVFWVEGLRVGERYKVTGATERRLRLAWERERI